MLLIYKSLLLFHIGIGFVSLILFWVPVFAKKGGALHVRSGHWFAKAMYAVGFSALALSLMLMLDPIGFKYGDHAFTPEERVKVLASVRDTGLFLLAISVLVIVGVRNGLQAVRAKGNHALMRRADNLLINLGLMFVGGWLAIVATGSSPMSVLFYLFATLCIVTAGVNLRFSLRKSVTRGDQIVAHLTSIIGAGIGSHTAFFVFGANRVFADVLTGYTVIIPWVLPAVVGNIIIWRQARRYRPLRSKVK